MAQSDRPRKPEAVVQEFFALLLSDDAPAATAWLQFRDRLYEHCTDFSDRLGKNLQGEVKLQMLSFLLVPILRNAFNDWETQTKFFPMVEQLGFHLLPAHFYSPVPELSRLANHDWQHRFADGGIFDAEAQLRLVQRLSCWRSELLDIPQDPDPAYPEAYYWSNPSFGPGDAGVYYAMIREYKPARILEIGGGLSTMIAARATLKNQGDVSTQLDCVEPYPSDALKSGFAGLTRLIEEPVQSVPRSEFENLSANDILFIDSTHVSKIGSDVNYLILEILPLIKPGVIVHIHDIYLPWDYSRELVVDNRLFWNEQYLLLAFLLFNEAFEVLIGNCFLSRECPDQVDAAWAGLPPFRGGSLWLRRH